MSNKNGANVYFELHADEDGNRAIKALEVVADAPVGIKEMASVLRGIARGLEA